MNLILDQGNSSFKAGLFDNNTLIKHSQFDYDNNQELLDWIGNQPIKNGIISSVVDQKIDLKNKVSGRIIYLDHHTPIPIQNKYKTPETLGNDRLANAVGAWAENPNQNSLIIDGGTCIKYDIVTAEGIYVGGIIAPGLNMRYRALHQFTDQLPALEPTVINYDIGTDTSSSIHGGAILGYNHEINGFISHYKQIFDPLTIFMTGGDQKYFDKTDKKRIFALQNLTLIGLNEILRYNVEAF